MKTAVARSWKSFTSKIHPPLPMTPRESNRLLSLLNASFKQKFDVEHPAIPLSNEHHADHHLQSILTNPLFDSKPQKRATSINKRHHIGQSLRQLQDIEQPIDAFKERVSRGTADLGTAKCCLRMQYKACLASPAATQREAMQSSKAASTILQWMWSSGLEETGKFLEDQDFLAQLMPFLIAEGQKSQVLDWLNRCQNPGETPFSSLNRLGTRRIQRFLIKGLIQADLRVGNGLESAINLFLWTIARLLDFGWTWTSVQNGGALDTAWVLAKVISRLPKADKPDPSIVHSFLLMMRRMKNDHLLTAYLDINIATRPDPQRALTFLHSISAELVPNMNDSRRFHTIFLGLRAAELFLQVGREAEALWIMEFLHTNFAKELGSAIHYVGTNRYCDPTRRLVREEEQFLHLLDTLTVQYNLFQSAIPMRCT